MTVMSSNASDGLDYDEQRPLLDRSTSPSSLESYGTAVDEKPAITPIPWGPISILLCFNALGPLAYELIFPFISTRPFNDELSIVLISPLRPDAR